VARPPGPAIGIAARVADQVHFVVGASVERLKWGIQTSREAAEQAGRDPDTLRFSAMIAVRPHEYLATARQLARAIVPSMSRFLIMNKKLASPTSELERVSLQRIVDYYDMRTHAQGARMAEMLDPQYIDSFAVVGPADQCLERQQQVAALASTD
jgi:5,10-methylenetetrahydromethanopterin reductase